ncbi:fibronectin type III domain-containing protein [Aquimarina gracilis]|uniref:Fibronectin type III domain-containing protein n=1 Tax=Aquimarina gracilis TaxID=874422 RepID=A0ABU5ZZ15_9FLAO|nr:fibronectin type III domain-containing protein [Aquimarina gracilis]MEB3347106.1 fibronectin type III domain-containing protein [Aquimarina gracilis]
MLRNSTFIKTYISAVLILISWLASVSSLHAQLFPVQVNLQMIPPYSLKISEYGTAQSERLVVNLLSIDVTDVSRRVALKVYIENNEGFSVQSNDVVVGANPIVLDGGIPVRLTNIDLRAYFSLQNLRGISPQQYNRTLSEGLYRFCFEVYDERTGQQLSRKSCATAYLVLNDPPFLNLPNRGELIAQKELQNIIFQWTPRHLNATNVQYEFTLAELWDTHINPQAAFLASRPLYQTTTFSNTLLYGPAEPSLLPDKNYAWRVRAIITDGISETSVFRNNGYSEIYHFIYTGVCDAPGYLLAEAINPTTQKILWQGAPHKQYKLQYRKKNFTSPNGRGREGAVWFEKNAFTEQKTIYNLEPGTTYEYRVGGMCKENTGYTYSQINEFTTTIAASDATTYTCGITPEIVITNQDPLQILVINDVFTAGDFPVTVKEVDLSSSMQDGIYNGWGYIVVPYLQDTRIKVVFNGIKINSDYQLIEGIVVTDYDQNWGGVDDVSDELEALLSLGDGIKELIQSIGNLLQNYTGSDKEKETLREQSEALADYGDDLASNPYVPQELKEELAVAEATYQEEIDKTLTASSEDTGPIDTTKEQRALKEVEQKIEAAEDAGFTAEAYASLGSDPSFKGTFEQLKKIVDYLKETAAHCKEKGWKSYQDEGIVPACIWENANIPQPLYYSKADLPYMSGLVDGLYQEGEGLVLLPQFLYQAGSGLKDFIYAYTIAYLECTPSKIAANEKRIGELLKKLEGDTGDGIWDWVTRKYSESELSIAQYQEKSCEEAKKLREEVDQLAAYLSEWENIEKLYTSIEEKLKAYFSNIQKQNNIGRYQEGKITVVVGSLFVSAGGLVVTKIGRVKKILQTLKTFTTEQWDKVFKKLDEKLGRGLSGITKFDDWIKTLKTKINPRRDFPDGKFEKKVTGDDMQYEATGNGEKIWADGIDVNKKALVDAKHNPGDFYTLDSYNKKPFLYGDLDDEFRRYSKIISDKSNPATELIIYISKDNPNSKLLFEYLAKKYDVPTKVELVTWKP